MNSCTAGGAGRIITKGARKMFYMALEEKEDGGQVITEEKKYIN